MTFVSENSARKFTFYNSFLSDLVGGDDHYKYMFDQVIKETTDLVKEKIHVFAVSNEYFMIIHHLAINHRERFKEKDAVTYIELQEMIKED